MRRLVGFAQSLAGAMGLLGLSLIFFSPVDLVFEMFPLKKCLFILLHFFFFLSLFQIPSIHS